MPLRGNHSARQRAQKKRLGRGESCQSLSSRAAKPPDTGNHGLPDDADGRPAVRINYRLPATTATTTTRDTRARLRRVLSQENHLLTKTENENATTAGKRPRRVATSRAPNEVRTARGTQQQKPTTSAAAARSAATRATAAHVHRTSMTHGRYTARHRHEAIEIMLSLAIASLERKTHERPAQHLNDATASTLRERR